MKKLISVFAALALVGSLAAQKGKKAPAKAPAAPAVAAPKAPAAPAVVAAAPAAAGAAKGVGLFIEGRGSYTFANGSSTAQDDGSTTGTSIESKLSNTAGFGGGGTIGYEIVSGLSLVGSFDFRQQKSREWAQTGATTSTKLSKSWNSQVIGVGIRPSINALGGSFFAGVGAAYVLAFDDTLSQLTTVTATGTLTAGTGTSAATSASKEVKTSWNGGIGMYGEFGYVYNITSNFYLGVGARLVVVTVNNDGKDTVYTDKSTSNFTTVTVTNKATRDTTATNPSQTAYQSNGVTDFAANVIVGFRF